MEYGSYFYFDQTEFVDVSTIPFAESEFREEGLIYIPNGCYDRTCKLHVAFHGCQSNSGQLAWYAEYNELAAKNNMIVLYPDSYCQNGAGVIDAEKWLTKDGLYHRAFSAMIERLTIDEDFEDCPAGSIALASAGFLVLAVQLLLNF